LLLEAKNFMSQASAAHIIYDIRKIEASHGLGNRSHHIGDESWVAPNWFEQLKRRLPPGSK
jgi:hypothetical protein